jgi:hypothetical protein
MARALHAARQVRKVSPAFAEVNRDGCVGKQ